MLTDFFLVFYRNVQSKYLLCKGNVIMDCNYNDKLEVEGKLIKKTY